MLRAVAGAVVALVAIAAPATAESGMRYWAYWDGTTGAWQYATEGAGTRILSDGAVEGWSFVVSSPQGAGAAQPRDAASFDTVCAHTPAAESKIRVALVVDPGTPTIAPTGETPSQPQTTCVVLDQGATGFDALAAAHDVRAESGFLCGLDGYPRKECAPVVDLDDFTPSSTPTPSATALSATPAPARDDPSSPLPTVITVAALGVLALAVGLARMRRRS